MRPPNDAVDGCPHPYAALMSRPDTAIEGVRAAHAQLALHLDVIDDAMARRSSLLPDWSVGHVLTHIARNAEGMAQMLEGAARGEVAEMYPGGVAARNIAIAVGSGRSAAELRVDVLESAARFETAAEALTAEQWTHGIGRRIQGDVAIAEVPRFRRREVLLHHVDLGLDGFTLADLPEDYVALDLPDLLATVPGRLGPSDRRALFGWVTGRTAELEPQFAALSPELDLRGVTTVSGDTQARALMVCRLLTAPSNLGDKASPSAQPFSGTWQVSHDMSFVFERRLSKKSWAPSLIFPGVIALSAGTAISES